MKNKILIIIGVLVIAALLGFAYDYFLGPEAVEGEKEVTVQIIIADQDINETYNFKTDKEFLDQLLEENKDKLGLSLESHDFGKMVTGMMDYQAGEKEFFHITINDKEAEVGIQDIPLQDDDKYIFELTTF